MSLGEILPGCEVYNEETILIVLSHSAFIAYAPRTEGNGGGVFVHSKIYSCPCGAKSAVADVGGIGRNVRKYNAAGAFPAEVRIPRSPI